MRENRGKQPLRVSSPVCVERRKCGALGCRAGNAGVHLRQLLFVFLQMPGELRILRMILEILACLRRRGGIRRIPNECLAKSGLGVRIVWMSLEDAHALGTSSSVVCEHRPQLDRKAWIAWTAIWIAIRQSAHGGNGRLLAVGRAIKGLVIGQGDIPIRRVISIQPPIDAHRIVRFALARQFACMAELVALGARTGLRLDFRDIRIVGVDLAQPLQCVAGLVDRADQLEVLG